MNILLWVLQVLLALHTTAGAVWKFSHTVEQTMPTLKIIPPGVWWAMSIVELICAVGLLLPAVNKSLGFLAPAAASVIAAEMLIFSGLHMSSGETNYSPIVYWLIVAAVCAFIAYGRWAPTGA
jgi:hypothetical protein